MENTANLLKKITLLIGCILLLKNGDTKFRILQYSRQKTIALLQYTSFSCRRFVRGKTYFDPEFVSIYYIGYHLYFNKYIFLYLTPTLKT